MARRRAVSSQLPPFLIKIIPCMSKLIVENNSGTRLRQAVHSSLWRGSCRHISRWIMYDAQYFTFCQPASGRWRSIFNERKWEDTGRADGNNDQRLRWASRRICCQLHWPVCPVPLTSVSSARGLHEALFVRPSVRRPQCLTNTPLLRCLQPWRRRFATGTGDLITLIDRPVGNDQRNCATASRSA